MSTVIKQIVQGSGDSQTIKMVVRDNERGPQGDKGDTGAAATIAAGNAYPLPAGSSPAVMNTGTSTAAVFDFYIPKGDTGPQGEKGDRGQQGPRGPQGAQGPKGDDGAIHYTAGGGITISSDNVISATGGTVAEWGLITGDIANQTDLQQEFAKYTPASGLATVATTGSYNDLTNKPTIPAAQIQSDWGQTNTSSLDYIKNKPSLAAVATSGSYSDLSNTPAIPTVNDAMLTIQQNGTNVATFTANSNTNTTANITSPVITMTTTDPGEGSALAANNFIGVYGGDPIIMDYSTTEVNTGAKWVDGSAIYKKTINLGALPNATTKAVAHGVSNFGYLVKIEGMSTYSGDNVFRPLPHVSVYSAADNILVEVSPTDVVVYTGVDRSAFSGYVTIYYTKSS